MTSTFQKLTKWIIVLLALVVFIGAGIFANSKQPQPLQINTLSTAQSENLYTLGKVWGLAKYYHPAFATGEKDWDKELLDLLPQVLQAHDRAEADTLLTNWILGLGAVTAGTPPSTMGIHTMHTTLEPSLSWLHDDTISPALSEALTPLLTTYISKRTGGPVTFTMQGTALFKNEKPYENMDNTDDGLRLLALFRYWNVIEYYFPYKDILGEDWDAVLAEFIPRVIEGDGLAYKLTLAELSTHIHDSHVFLSESIGGYGYAPFQSLWGARYAPLQFLMVDGRIVVSDLTAKYADVTPLRLGDVVSKIDGVETQVVIAEKLKYISVSRDDAVVLKLSQYLFRTKNDSMTLTVLRDGQTLELQVPCYFDGLSQNKSLPSHELLEGNIGLINPGYLKQGELGSIMKEFKDTQGLIVDLRQYPSDPIVYTLGAYIMPHSKAFAKLSFANPAVPGNFQTIEPTLFVSGSENPDSYKGKVVILISEESMSQAEFTTMALRQAPNATVIGNPSQGADGNIVTMVLPGGVNTTFTGLGVYTPDGGQTQRIGLQPDLFCYPTIEGISQGRDELMEKAIEHIKSAASN